MERQKKEIGMLGLIAWSVLLLSNSTAFADGSVPGEAIVSYSRIDEQGEVYNPSDPSAKAAERTAFCSCVQAITNPVNPAVHIFDSCAPIHPVLPNLPQSFITNHLLNEVVIHIADANHVDYSNLNNVFQALASCTDTFSIEYSVSNDIYTTDLPNIPGLPNPGSTSGTGTLMPNDQYFHYQWALHNEITPGADIDWSPTIEQTAGGNGGIIVAVIDTGVDYNHPDLAANMWVDPEGIDIHGYDFVNADNLDHDPMDTNGHGTEMAGVVAAAMNNGPNGTTGIAGVCPNCKIMALKAAEDVFTADRVAAAVGYAIVKGADVINMSFFKRFSTGNPNPFGSAAPELLTAYQDGIVLVASAGNYSDPNAGDLTLTKFAYPAAFGYPGSANESFDVIAVSATDNANARAVGFPCVYGGTSYNNCITIYGPWVDISAPGKDIFSTVPVGLSDNSGDALYGCAHPDPTNDPVGRPGYCPSGGSSFSAAHVSGVAALILSRNPDWDHQNVCGATYDQPCATQHDYVRDLMKKYSANVLSGLTGMGAGLLDAGAAVSGVVPLPTNLPPVWTYPDINPNHPTLSIEAPPNGNVGFGLRATDPEGEPVTVSAVTLPLGAEIIPWEMDVNGDGVNEVYYDFYWAHAVIGEGEGHQATFAASDGVNPAVNLTVPMHIEPFNRPPVFGPLPTRGSIYIYDNTFVPYGGDTIILPEGATFSFAFDVTDPNGHAFGVCIDDLMEGLFDSIGKINGAATMCSGYLGTEDWLDYPHNGPGPFNYTLQAPIIPSGGQRSFHLRFIALDQKLGLFDDLSNRSDSVTVSDDFRIYVNAAPIIDPTLASTVVVSGTQLDFTVKDFEHDITSVTSSMLPTGGSLSPSGIDTFRMTWTLPQTMDRMVNLIATNSLTDSQGITHAGATSQKSVMLDFDTSRPYAYNILPSNNSCTRNIKQPFSATVTDDRALGSYTLKLYRGVRVQNGQSVVITFPEPPLYTKSGSLSGRGPVNVSLTPSADLYPNDLYKYTYEFNDAQKNRISSYRYFTYTTTCGLTACFLPGTPISMADGSMKSIESVVIGDQVVAFDEKTGEMATDTVSQVFIHNDIHTGYLEINDMKVTSEHPLWIKDKGWTKAGEVKVGDILLRQDNTDEPITHIKPVEGKYTVHNLETQPHHTYYAQGKRVHNKSIV